MTGFRTTYPHGHPPSGATPVVRLPAAYRPDECERCAIDDRGVCVAHCDACTPGRWCGWHKGQMEEGL